MTMDHTGACPCAGLEKAAERADKPLTRPKRWAGDFRGRSKAIGVTSSRLMC